MPSVEMIDLRPMQVDIPDNLRKSAKAQAVLAGVEFRRWIAEAVALRLEIEESNHGTV